MNKHDSIWIDLESLSYYPRRLESLPLINSVDQINSLIDNVIIYATLLALGNFFLNITPVISVQSPLDLNTDFPVQIRSFGLLEWNFMGLAC